MKSITNIVFLLLACVLSVSAQSGGPRVYFLNDKTLSEVRDRIQLNDKAFVPAYKRLIKDADKCLKQTPGSVMEKKQTPPSGDKHDYMSMGRYFWPDPSKPDGLPYINRDGETNPEAQDIADAGNFGRFSGSAWTLSLAYYFTGKAEYAEHAARVVRTWFLDSATAMNPNMSFAQFVEGKNEGRSSGVLDLRGISRVIDAIGLIAPSGYWTSDDQGKMLKWSKAYLSWLRTSSNGIKESQATNNHGVWYDVQTVSVACFAGEFAIVRSILEQAKTERIGKQIEPDGSMPRELARTRSKHYVMFNLEAFGILAGYGKSFGIDLWHYRTPDGRSIRAAFDWVIPFVKEEKEWTWKEIANAPWNEFYSDFIQASVVYPDGGFDALAHNMETEKGISDALHLVFGR